MPEVVAVVVVVVVVVMVEEDVCGVGKTVWNHPTRASQEWVLLRVQQQVEAKKKNKTEWAVAKERVNVRDKEEVKAEEWAVAKERVSVRDKEEVKAEEWADKARAEAMEWARVKARARVMARVVVVEEKGWVDVVVEAVEEEEVAEEEGVAILEEEEEEAEGGMVDQDLAAAAAGGMVDVARVEGTSVVLEVAMVLDMVLVLATMVVLVLAVEEEEEAWNDAKKCRRFRPL
jgi:hypothetical protein